MQPINPIHFIHTAQCLGLIRVGQDLCMNDLDFYQWAWEQSADQREFELRICSMANIEAPRWYALPAVFDAVIPPEKWVEANKSPGAHLHWKGAVGTPTPCAGGCGASVEFAKTYCGECSYREAMRNPPPFGAGVLRTESEGPPIPDSKN